MREKPRQGYASSLCRPSFFACQPKTHERARRRTAAYDDAALVGKPGRNLVGDEVGRVVDPCSDGSAVVGGELRRRAAAVSDGLTRAVATELALELLDEGAADGEAVGDGLLGGCAGECGAENALSEDGREGGHQRWGCAPTAYDHPTLTLVDNQAIVTPETIDAIRALTGLEADAGASIARTNAALGIGTLPVSSAVPAT